MSYNSRPAIWVTTVDKIQYEGSGIPSDGTGNIGDRYFDTTSNQWWVKRYVGNFSGPDSVNIPAIPLIGANNWSVEFNIWLDPAIANWGNVMCNGSGGAGSTMIRAMSSGQLNVDYYGKQGIYTVPLSKSKWYKVKINGTYNGVTLYDRCIIDGIGAWESSSADGVRISGNGITLGGVFSGSQFIGKMCNVKGSGSGYSINLPMNDGTGTKIQDYSGSNFNATITDGSPNDFWLATWVPINLSYPIV